MNKKLAKYLSYIFAALTIIGAIYVLKNDGNTNPDYAVIPMVITLGLQNYTRGENKRPLNKKIVIISFCLCIVVIGFLAKLIIGN